MVWQDYVEERPDVVLGKPVFKGTRITEASRGEGRPVREMLEEIACQHGFDLRK